MSLSLVLSPLKPKLINLLTFIKGKDESFVPTFLDGETVANVLEIE